MTIDAYRQQRRLRAYRQRQFPPKRPAGWRGPPRKQQWLETARGQRPLDARCSSGQPVLRFRGARAQCPGGQGFQQIIRDPIHVTVEAGRKAAPEAPADPFEHALPPHVLPPLLGTMVAVAIAFYGERLRSAPSTTISIRYPIEPTCPCTGIRAPTVLASGRAKVATRIPPGRLRFPPAPAWGSQNAR